MRAAVMMVFSSLFFLTACGGGGGGGNSNPPNPPPPATADGRFLDAVVQGLSYVSGGQSGITDAGGIFTYEVGGDVTFSVGMVEIGTVPGDAIITPVDITGASSSDTATQNIVRFLLMLDSDGDSGNGISISDDVRSIAANWMQPDFAAANLDGELASIIADVAAADNRTPVLPTAQEAQAHLEGTLACLSSGVFAGTFSGSDNGSFLLWIQHERFDPIAFGDNTPRVGVTSALVYSTDDDIVLGVAPQEGLSFNRNQQFLSGVVANGAEFSGELQEYTTLANGSWQNGLTGDSGSFSGERKGGDADAVHRLSGFFNLQGMSFTADGSGLIALDILSDDSVTGLLITLRGDETALSGTLAGTDLSVSGGDYTLTAQFDADGTDSSNDPFLGSTSGFLGTMSDSTGTSDAIGTSCQPE